MSFSKTYKRKQNFNWESETRNFSASELHSLVSARGGIVTYLNLDIKLQFI